MFEVSSFFSHFRRFEEFPLTGLNAAGHGVVFLGALFRILFLALSRGVTHNMVSACKSVRLRLRRDEGLTQELT